MKVPEGIGNQIHHHENMRLTFSFTSFALHARIPIAFVILIFSGMNTARSQPVIQYLNPDNATGTSAAAMANKLPLAHTAQLWPLNEKGELVGKGDPAKQTEQVIENIARALTEAGSGLTNLVKMNVYVTGPEVVPAVQETFSRRFNGPVKPAVSFVAGNLAHPEAQVGMDAIAAAADTSNNVAVRRLRASSLGGKQLSAHVAVLPPKNAFYVSGQAEAGELPSATRKTLESLQKTLLHFGLKRSTIVQLKAFMRPMSDVSVVENEIVRFFESEPVPPLVFVEWTMTAPIEIELIASAASNPGDSRQSVTFLTPPGMTASPLYSRVARVNSDKIIFMSGLYGSTPQDAEAQIREVFSSLGQLLKKTGSDFNHLVKATYYVSDESASTKLNQLRPNYYDPKRPPAASKAMVKSVGMTGKSITVDMIAVTP
jgi:enamine deaminase RidA (YjgF/YER057c/UK114 family)